VFNLSGSEIVVILLLALVVLGPEKLPDALRRAGKTYAELKRMSSSFQSEMRSALDEPMTEMRETADLLRKSAQLGADETAAPARAPGASASVHQPSTTSRTPGPETPEPTAAAEPAARTPADEEAATQSRPEGAPAVRDEDGTSA